MITAASTRLFPFRFEVVYCPVDKILSKGGGSAGGDAGELTANHNPAKSKLYTIPIQ